MRALRFALPVAIFVAITWFLLRGLDRDPREIPSPLIDKPAPDFSLARLDQPEQTKKLCDELKQSFDFVLLDCPAGIEQGFANAVAGANKAIVVTTPEVSAIRDADRIIGLLEAQDLRDISLVINRIRPDMVKRGEMMSVDDVQEILAVPLLGILPDDEQVVIATNQGEAIAGSGSKAGEAFTNISHRILGESVPYLDLDSKKGFFRRVFGR